MLHADPYMFGGRLIRTNKTTTVLHRPGFPLHMHMHTYSPVPRFQRMLCLIFNYRNQASKTAKLNYWKLMWWHVARHRADSIMEEVKVLWCRKEVNGCGVWKFKHQFAALSFASIGQSFADHWGHCSLCRLRLRYFPGQTRKLAFAAQTFLKCDIACEQFPRNVFQSLRLALLTSAHVILSKPARLKIQQPRNHIFSESHSLKPFIH